MLAGEVIRFFLDRMFYSAPTTLDGELARLERIYGGRTYSLHLTVQHNGRTRPGELWMSASFNVRFAGSTGLPTEQMRPRMSFDSTEEPRRLWDWICSVKSAGKAEHIDLEERFYPDPAELSGEALLDHNLQESLDVLAAPLRSLRAISWCDDRGHGSGINVHAYVESNFPNASNPVNATIYGGEESADERALIRAWGERTATACGVPFRFD